MSRKVVVWPSRQHPKGNFRIAELHPLEGGKGELRVSCDMIDVKCPSIVQERTILGARIKIGTSESPEGMRPYHYSRTRLRKGGQHSDDAKRAVKWLKELCIWDLPTGTDAVISCVPLELRERVLPHHSGDMSIRFQLRGNREYKIGEPISDFIIRIGNKKFRSWAEMERYNKDMAASAPVPAVVVRAVSAVSVPAVAAPAPAAAAPTCCAYCCRRTLPPLVPPLHLPASAEEL